MRPYAALIKDFRRAPRRMPRSLDAAASFEVREQSEDPPRLPVRAEERAAFRRRHGTDFPDGLGHLLKTDQRGNPRPDTEDTGGCDLGAYERQSD